MNPTNAVQLIGAIGLVVLVHTLRADRRSSSDAHKYVPGDELLAHLQEPNLEVIVRCVRPDTWVVLVFDFVRKSIVERAELSSCKEAKEYAQDAVFRIYGRQVADVVWKEALVRRFDPLAE